MSPHHNKKENIMKKSTGTKKVNDLLVDQLIEAHRFPTPKTIIHHLQRGDFRVGAYEVEYITERCKMRLEDLMMTAQNPAHIASIRKYLEANFTDWVPIKEVHEAEEVVIKFDLDNSSGRSLTEATEPEEDESEDDDLEETDG